MSIAPEENPKPAHEPSEAQMRRMVEKVVPFIQRKLRQLYPHLSPALREEALQEACARTVLAARRYDPERFDTRFLSYARPHIAGAIHDVLLGEIRAREEVALVAAGARDHLAETSDRFEVMWDPPDVNRERLAALARSAVAAQWACVAAGSSFGSAEDALIEDEVKQRARVVLAKAFAHLGTQERRVYEGHYVAGRTFVEIAAELGVDPRTVRRHHEALLAGLGATLRAEGIDANPGTLGP